MTLMRSGSRCAAALAAVLLVTSAGTSPSSLQAAPGARPADFTLPNVPGTAWRGRFRLAEHLGKRPVVVAFFATWCRPCEIELPLLDQIRTRFSDQQLAMVAVAIDGPESAAQIAPTSRRLKLRLPVVHDADSTVSSRLNPQRSVPFLITIDRHGKVVNERSGFSAEHQAKLAAEIEALVVERP
jgi:cytochrome c biogenesis protein CcmG, thiol:disulfide interchange protein DsbE